MEPRVAAESDGSSPPIVGWTCDSPSSPSSEVFKTANASPIILRRGSHTSLSLYSSPEKSFLSNNNEIISNGDGVKFIDPDGNIHCIDKDDSICSSGSSEDSEDEKKPEIPDGGWGWVVVFSSLVISMVADGISFSFGLLYIQFLNHFGESKAKTSWIGSLFMAVPLLSGPVMSALVDRYGCKWMTIAGGLVAGSGFVMAAFGETIEFEYITFGVIAGLGLGLCYVTAVVAIAYWFDKRRTLATSLGACGTGIGTFVYAPMTQYFIDEYGWRGTVLLLAGTFLNMCVCGAVMREPEWYIEEHRTQASLAGTKSARNSSSCGSISGVDGESTFPGPEDIRNMIRSGKSPEYILTTTLEHIREEEKKEGASQLEKPRSSHSVVNLPTYVHQEETVPIEVLHKLSGNGRLVNIILENYPTLLSCRSLSDQGKLHQIDGPEQATKRIVPTMSLRVKKKKKSPVPVEETLYEEFSDDALKAYNEPLLSPTTETVPVIVNGLNGYGKPAAPPAINRPPFRRRYSVRDPGMHHLKNIRVHRNSVMYRGATLNIPKYRLRASSCPNIYRNSMTTLAREDDKKWYADAVELFCGIFDFSMFLELHFLFMSISTILLFTWFIVPYFYLTDYMVDHGFEEKDGSLVISIVGIINCIGMVALGWAGDQPWVNQPKAYAMCMLGCGISLLLMPLLITNWWLTAINGCLFGMTFASTYSFTPTILVSLIPLERFTTAYGLILLCQGIGNLLGPPIAGALTDYYGIWDYSFYAAGVWIIVCAGFIILIPYTKNRRIWGNAQLEMDRISIA